MTTPPARGEHGHWLPGTSSPNPRGAPRRGASLVELFDAALLATDPRSGESYFAHIVRGLAELAAHHRDPQLRVRAAEVIFRYRLPKPEQQISVRSQEEQLVRVVWAPAIWPPAASADGRPLLPDQSPEPAGTGARPSVDSVDGHVVEVPDWSEDPDPAEDDPDRPDE
jgi:hypothetical protein